jgi:hypothetical protein
MIDRKALIKEAQEIIDSDLTITFAQYYRIMLEIQIEIMKKQDKAVYYG